MVNLILNLHASNSGDFELPSNMFDDLGGPVIKTIDSAVNLASRATTQTKEFIIDHPKEMAIVTGVLATGVILALNEKNLRAGEGLDAVKTCSRPGLLNIPFQHGFKPYFSGPVVGSATGVVLQRLQLKQAISKLVRRCEALKIDTYNIKQQAKKDLEQAKQVSQQAQNNLEQVQKLNKQATELETDSRATRDAIDNLSVGIVNTEQAVVSLDAKVDSLRQGVYAVAGVVTQANQDLETFVSDASVVTNNLVKGQAGLASGLGIATQQARKMKSSLSVQENQIRSINNSQTSHQVALKSVQKNLKRAKNAISDMSGSIDKSLEHIAILQKGKNICTGGGAGGGAGGES